MMDVHRSRICAGLIAAIAVCLLTAAGCGDSGPLVVVNKNSDLTRDRLIQVAYAYREAFTRTGRSPTSLGDLRPIMRETDTPEEALVSPRDGQPFVVVWGKPLIVAASADHVPSILIHEAIGKDGSRYVYWDIGIAELIPEQKFQASKRTTTP